MLPVPSAGPRPVLDSMPPGGLLAMDLGGRFVGIAYALIWMAVPAWIQWELPALGGRGCKGNAFMNLLEPFMERFEPSQVILERALPLGAMNNWSVTYQQFGLAWQVNAEAYRLSAALTEVDSATVRSEVMGQRRFSKDTVKREVVAECRRRGIKLTASQHHAADACLTWFWLQRRLRGLPPVAGPLFREREDAA